MKASTHLFGTRESLKNNYLNRAIGVYLGIYANTAQEAFYNTWPMDSEGGPLDGNNKYVIRFERGYYPFTSTSQQVVHRCFIIDTHCICGKIAVASITHQQTLALQVAANTMRNGVC